MALTYNEAGYENSIIELFTQMGYEHIHGPDIIDERDVRGIDASQ